MVVVDQLNARNLCTLFIISDIDMNFGARTTRAGIAHFPEIIFFVSVDNSILWQILFPQIESFLIAGYAIFCIAFENSCIQPVGRNAQFLHKKLPRPINGIFLEIVTKRPVSQHLEHGVVIGIVTNFLKVVVFP